MYIAFENIFWDKVGARPIFVYLLFIYLMCVGVLPACMSVDAWKSMLDIWDWSYGLSQHMGAGNKTRVLWKNSQGSWPMSHLYSPTISTS